MALSQPAAEVSSGSIAGKLPRRLLANALRFLSVDAVEKAGSGHPGAPLGMADIIEVLWNDFMRHNPGNPKWPDRDRFVLSNGHASMLLYSVLHLSGYELPLAELRKFRQLGSKTPGHPEVGLTPGVETTTGPLGQGFANAVGMALAERSLAAFFNRPGFDVVDHRTFVTVGEGCLMEGISHEAASLAGVLALGKLNLIYDRNRISIDGDTDGWFIENTAQRFAAYGWHVIDKVDGHDATAIHAALSAAVAETGKPSLICMHTVIGYGAPSKAGKESSHGAPLGKEELSGLRANLDWPHEPFAVPDDVTEHWNAKEHGLELERQWQQKFAKYKEAHPTLATEFERRVMRSELPLDWDKCRASFFKQCCEVDRPMATRVCSQNSLSAYTAVLPELIGGSADLTGSNGTWHEHSQELEGDSFEGNYLRYGVREFGMAAVNNGIALHGGLIPYCGTFLVFSDYMRNAIRMAALMHIKQVFVLTHDSIGLGEDGPTHQPVEHAASLRLIPGLSVWRPCDAAETAVAWAVALQTDGPTAMLCSRQSLPQISHSVERAEHIARGGYIASNCDQAPELIIIATGSEVSLALAAAEVISGNNHTVRVVSMPSVDIFELQDAAWRQQVLPTSCRRRLVVEAGTTASWHRYAGEHGKIIGLDSFGESAPGKDVLSHFGLTVEAVVAAAQSLLSSKG